MKKDNNKKHQPDYDSPWKEGIEKFFPDFMKFFFPEIHGDIDWNRSYEFMDKELERTVRDAEIGRRYADKLVKIFLRGEKQSLWLLIHIEVQASRQPKFSHRMYVYNYRIHDKFKSEVVSLAIFTDDEVSYKPNIYRKERWGCTLHFEFPIIKLIDYAADFAKLEQSDNLFSIVVMAHLKAKQTEGQERKKEKLQLLRMLSKKGFRKEDTLELLRFIDWLLVLPKQLEQEIEEELLRTEEQIMPYITTYEHKGRQEGRQETRQEIIIEALEIRFGKVAKKIIQKIRDIVDSNKLKELHQEAITASSLEEFSQKV